MNRFTFLLLIILPAQLTAQSFETVVEDKDVPFFSSLAFQDSLTGWAVGWGGTIYKFDRGQWSRFKSPVKSTLNKIFVDNSGKGWIVGDNGTLLKLIDNAWVKIQLETEENLNDIYYNNDFGFIVGNNGLHYKCINNKWTQIALDTKEHLFCISMSDKKNGFILGWNRTLIKMAGDQFSQITQGDISGMNHPYYYFYAIEYIKENEAYILGQEIVHFDNGKFKIFKSDYSPIIRDSEKVNDKIWLISNSNVYCLKNNELIEIKDNYYQDFKAISFSSSNLGWVVGDGGLIIKLTE